MGREAAFQLRRGVARLLRYVSVGAAVGLLLGGLFYGLIGLAIAFSDDGMSRSEWAEVVEYTLALGVVFAFIGFMVWLGVASEPVRKRVRWWRRSRRQRRRLRDHRRATLTAGGGDPPRRDMAVLGAMGEPGLAWLHSTLAPKTPKPRKAPKTTAGWTLLRLRRFVVATVVMAGRVFVFGLAVVVVWALDGALGLLSGWVERFWTPLLVAGCLFSVGSGVVAARQSREALLSLGKQRPFRPILLIGRFGVVTTTVPGDLGGAIVFAATEDINQAWRIDVTVDRAFDLGPGGERTWRPDLVGVRQVATNRKGSRSGETGEKVVLVCTEGGTSGALDLIGRLSTWADDWAASDATGRPGDTRRTSIRACAERRRERTSRTPAPLRPFSRSAPAAATRSRSSRCPPARAHR